MSSTFPTKAKIAIGLAPLVVAGSLLLVEAALSDQVVTERVSLTETGLEANGASTNPTISADGRFIAFTSSADNLVADDACVPERFLGAVEEHVGVDFTPQTRDHEPGL